MSVRIVPKTPSAYAYPLLIKYLLQSNSDYAAGQEIVYGDRSRYDYQTLSRRVAKLANALGDLGVRQGDTVAVMDWDSHRYLECYFAVPMLGAVLHTINIRLPRDLILYTVNHAEDDLLIVHTDFLPLIEAIAPFFETSKKIVVIDEGQGPLQTGLEPLGEYEALLRRSGTTYVFPDFDEQAVATLFYTTGTTGRPKGVCFSHRQIVLHTLGFMSALCAYRSPFPVDSGDVYMPLTPMFHVHAWGMPYLFTMLGAKQVYPGRFDPERVLSLVHTEAVSFSHCVPTIVRMLLDSPALDRFAITGWKILVGGSALPRSLCQAARDRGISLFSAYGMSETGPLMTVANLTPGMFQRSEGQQMEARCRTGLPAPLVHLDVLSPEGTPLPHDGRQVGEVVVRSPWLTQAYFKEPERSEALWTDGWLHTGDLGSIDREGYLQISDRIKDVIKTGGEWVSSLELEDCISGHQAVREAAVIAIPDSKWDERPLALVVLKTEFHGRIQAEDIRTFLQRHAAAGKLPRFAIPERIEIVEAIAKTSVGKIDKKELRRRFCAV